VFQQQTADGFVDMLLMQEAPWRALLEILGSPAWGQDEIFATHPLRSQYWDALEPLLQEELRKATTARLYEEGQRRGVAIAPVNTIAQAAGAEQFTGRGFFTRLAGKSATPAPGRPFQLGECSAPGAAPGRGEHNRLVLVEWLEASDEELRAAGAVL
jgi:crotonobetainyl-CoA:carnitine CoA-transferase CaiB-like acyl-CoA transferase